MKTYKTLEIIDVFGGLIGLTEKQAAKRPELLKKIKPGIYEILRSVQFKEGEVIKLANSDKVTLSKLAEVKKGTDDL